MPTNTEPRRPWSEVLRRAAMLTVRVAPWVWVTSMLAVVFEGAWTLSAIGRVTLVAIEVLPLLFLTAVAVQRFPRSWYRAR
jgi:hypothetical protein